MIEALFECILKLVKPFYGIPKAGNHWFTTYHNYYFNTFAISISTYGPFLVHRCELFSIIRLSTNGILILTNNIFAIMKEKTIKTTKFITKKQACFLS